MMNKKFDIFGSIWITSKLKPVFTYCNWKRSSNLNMNEEKKTEKFASFVPKLTLFEWESSLNGFVLKSLFFHFPNTKAHVLKYLQKFIECSNKDSTPLNAMHRPFNWLHFLMRSKNPATKNLHRIQHSGRKRKMKNDSTDAFGISAHRILLKSRRIID